MMPGTEATNTYKYRDLETYWHPIAFIRDNEACMSVFDMFRFAGRELTKQDYDTMSFWEVEAFEVMRSASFKEEADRYEDLKDNK